MARRIEVCPVEDLEPGEKLITDVDGLPHSVGVFNVDGEYYALANVCPHHLAPLCQGEITGVITASRVGEYELEREGEVVQCPWHGWQFDIADGTSVFNPHALKTRTYQTAVERAEAAGRAERDRAEPDEESAVETTDSDEEPAVGTTDSDEERYGTELLGDEPPIETYDVGVERELVVLYV